MSTFIQFLSIILAILFNPVSLAQDTYNAKVTRNIIQKDYSTAYGWKTNQHFLSEEGWFSISPDSNTKTEITKDITHKDFISATLLFWAGDTWITQGLCKSVFCLFISKLTSSEYSIIELCTSTGYSQTDNVISASKISESSILLSFIEYKQNSNYYYIIAEYDLTHGTINPNRKPYTTEMSVNQHSKDQITCAYISNKSIAACIIVIGKTNVNSTIVLSLRRSQVDIATGVTSFSFDTPVIGDTKPFLECNEFITVRIGILVNTYITFLYFCKNSKNSFDVFSTVYSVSNWNDSNWQPSDFSLTSSVNLIEDIKDDEYKSLNFRVFKLTIVIVTRNRILYYSPGWSKVWTIKHSNSIEFLLFTFSDSPLRMGLESKNLFSSVTSYFEFDILDTREVSYFRRYYDTEEWYDIYLLDLLNAVPFKNIAVKILILGVDAREEVKLYGGKDGGEFTEIQSQNSETNELNPMNYYTSLRYHTRDLNTIGSYPFVWIRYFNHIIEGNDSFFSGSTNVRSIKIEWKRCNSTCLNCWDVINTEEDSCFDCKDTYYWKKGTSNCDPCYASCLKCGNLGDDNRNECDVCKKNWFNFVYTNSENDEKRNCLDQKPDGYYWVDNALLIDKCSAFCATCTKGYHAATDEMNCATCVKGYYKKEEETAFDANCFPSDIPLDGYIFQNDVFRKCPVGCKKCEAGPTNQSFTCWECFADFYFLTGTDLCYDTWPKHYVDHENTEWKPCTRHCNQCGYSSSAGVFTVTCSDCETNFVLHNSETECKYQLDGYYFDEDTQEEVRCNYSCKTCEEGGNETTHNCLSCIESMVVNEAASVNGNCVYNEFYYDHENGAYDECYETCETCDERGDNAVHKCITCKNGFYEFENTSSKHGNCAMNDEEPDAHYFDDEVGVFKQCFVSCRKCVTEGNAFDHNCIECSGDYISELGTSNCYSQCKENQKWILDIDDGNFYCLARDTCLVGYPFYNSVTHECGKQCNTIPCNIATSRDFSSNWNTFRENIAEMFEHELTIKTEDYQIEISEPLKPDDPVPRDKISVKLGVECEAKIRKEMNIANDEPWLVLILTEQNADAIITPKVDYEVYTRAGEKVDLSICENASIEVNVPITNTDILSIMKEFQLDGIDVFDEDDQFFNDFCMPYSSGDRPDMPWKTRREEIFQGKSVCEDGCTWWAIIDDVIANCGCPPQRAIDTSQYESQSIGTGRVVRSMFTDVFSSWNIKVITCWENVFSRSIFSNIGFYVMTTFVCVECALSVAFWVINEKIIHVAKCWFEDNRKQAQNVLPVHPPRRSLGEDGSNRNDNVVLTYFSCNNGNDPGSDRSSVRNRDENGEEVENNLVLAQNKKDKNFYNYFDTASDGGSAVSSPYIKRDKTSNCSHNDNGMNNINKINTSNNQHNQVNVFKNTINIRPRRAQAKASNHRFSNNTQNHQHHNASSMRSFQIISKDSSGVWDGDIHKHGASRNNKATDERAALKEKPFYDKTLCEIFFFTVRQRHILFLTFIIPKYSWIRIINITNFMTSICFSFTWNAWFYSDEIIADNYKSKHFYDFEKELPKTWYSVAIGLIFNVLFKMLSKISPVPWDHPQRKGCSAFKFIIYFVFALLFQCLCWYFVCAFCGVYRNSQIKWVISTVTSVVIGLSAPLGLMFVYAILIKRIGKTKNKCLLWLMKLFGMII